MNEKPLFLALLFLLLHSSSVSQSAEEYAYLTDSSQSLQFGIGDYLGVRAFNTKMISFKIHTSTLRAIRFGLFLSGSTRKDDYTTDIILGDSIISSVLTDVDPQQAVTAGVNCHFMWLAKSPGDVFPFIGVGPLVEYSLSEYAGRSTASWAFGLSATVGGEWFATKTISLHAEYQASLTYEGIRRKSSEYETLNGQLVLERVDRKSTTWALRSLSVVFGFSIYL